MSVKHSKYDGLDLWIAFAAGMAVVGVLFLIAKFSLPSEVAPVIGQKVGIQVEIEKLSPELEQAIIDFINSFQQPSSEARFGSIESGFNNSGAGNPPNTPDQSFLSCPSQIKVGQEHSGFPTWSFKADLEIIRRAAQRNGCLGDNFSLLLAIRKAEQGSPGNEFGVRGVRGLDKQAGWAAASIIKSRRRWNAAGRPKDFISFLGNRYCPSDAHPLNKHWIKNVKFFFKKFKNAERNNL